MGDTFNIDYFILSTTIKSKGGIQPSHPHSSTWNHIAQRIYEHWRKLKDASYQSLYYLYRQYVRGGIQRRENGM